MLTGIFILAAVSVLFSDETGIYRIPVSDYVTGRFTPSAHPLFVNLKKSGIPCSRNNMYLRTEAVSSLKKMLAGFNRDNPELKITVISATRNFSAQKRIWDGKWNGRRRVTGVKDIRKISDPVLRAKIILNYSSMPGTSRHHWGSDFDINALNNRYYEKGKGLIIYNWLKENASRYGFCQPYTSGRKGGYNNEKWHWSYMPLAGRFILDWNRLYRDHPSLFIKPGIFKGSAEAGNLAPVYVNTIDGKCK